jgi:ribonuclease HI
MSVGKSVGIFTDGACSKNGKVGARASWAFYFPDHKSFSNAGRVPDDQPQTNQRGELMAIYEAIKTAELNFPSALTDLKIYTDSMYSKNCLTTWISNWVRNNWKTSQGGDVIHRDLIEETVNMLSKFKSFNITYVKAHTGDDDENSRNNDIVDKMATRVLDDTPVKVVKSNKEEAIEGLPLKIMGPPVYEHDLTKWCLDNLDSLDKSYLNAAILSALSKTLKKKGFVMEKQRLHRSILYRIKTDNGLINEDVVVVKE